MPLFRSNRVQFTPTGTIAAVNVQSAIAEAALEALQKSANLSDLADVAVARTNLGLSEGGGGTAGTIAIGTVVLGSEGQASVTNSGTASAAVLNFVIPQGARGFKGSSGNPGATGDFADSATIAKTSFFYG